MSGFDSRRALRHDDTPLESDRIARHPVTVEDAGSNPVKGAEHRGTVRQLVERSNLNLEGCGFDSHPCYSEPRVGRHNGVPPDCNPGAFGRGRFDPCPTHFECGTRSGECGMKGTVVVTPHSDFRTPHSTKARSSSGSGRQPLTLVSGVRFPHGSITVT